MQNPTSRSRYTGMIGFCTAPNRASAACNTSVDGQVGNCHETDTPGPYTQLHQPRRRPQRRIPILQQT